MDGILQVFEVRQSDLFVSQQMSFDLQAPGTGVEFDPATRILTVRARTNDDSPHCCPKGVDVVTFRWDGKAFLEKTHRTIPVEGR